MPRSRSTILSRLLAALAGLVILKVTAVIVLNYRNYFPPNFDSDFLRGREAYFFGSYRWSFYPHILAGPVALVVGTILVSERFRLRFPAYHRYLGRLQVLNVLCVVAPSGLWMAGRAAAGPIAAAGFAVLALLTGWTTAMGWRSAVRRQFAVHRRWMWRCYLLLCSTVILRLAGGLATVAGAGALWIDPLIAWASWIVPLGLFEVWTAANRNVGRSLAQPAPASSGALPPGSVLHAFGERSVG